MKTVTVGEAKAQLAKLLDRVSAGEEIVIERAGKPVAKLVPCEAPPKRVPGGWKGKVWMATDFDAHDKEIEALFYDGPIEPAKSTR